MFKKLKWLILPLLLSALESSATFSLPDYTPPDLPPQTLSTPTSRPTFAHFAHFVVSSSSDPSGSLQGAGGIGGLLCVIDGRANPQGEPYFPCFDANGNIVQYIDDEGTVVAAREYGPFGETTSATGTMQDDFTFWFSTKYWDIETGLGYWGMRYYHPEQGRWLSRDPLGEEGGLLLYGFVGNDPVGGVDLLGLADTPIGKLLERTNPLFYMERYNQYLSRGARWLGRNVRVLEKPMEVVAFGSDFSENLVAAFDPADMIENYSTTISRRITTREHVFEATTTEAVKETLCQVGADTPIGLIMQGVYGKSLDPWDPQEREPWWQRASKVSGGIGGTAGICAWGLIKFSPSSVPKTTAPKTVKVTRWQDPPSEVLKPGNWVVKGGKNPWNWTMSGKMNPLRRRFHVPFKEGRTHVVPKSTLKPPSGSERFKSWWPWKQKRYYPEGGG